MKFIDVAIIRLQAGKGGDGAVAFRRELYVPKGGPSGGDGGKGGDIIFVGDEGKNTLLDLKYRKEIKAENGENGDIKNMHGKNAKNTYVHVPLGTIIYDNKTNKVICDVIEHNKEYIVARGGKGGRGNARFASSRNKAPTNFEAGDLGDTIEIRCELKVLADVGLVGLPNAGKSTLLSKITKAKPQIADYPFTTLTPQLGVAHDQNNNTFVIADLPGLIKDASEGKGLGHDFLRHVERCKIIVHLLDMSGNYGQEDVIDNYLQIRKELLAYNNKLANISELVVANKMDLEESKENLKKFKSKFKDLEVIEISGLKSINLNILLNRIGELLTSAKTNKTLWEQQSDDIEDNSEFTLYEYKEEVKDIKITRISENTWNVEGEDVFKIYHKYPISTYDNLLLFNKKLQELQVFKLLAEKGAKQGDTIKIYDYELEWEG